FPPTPSRPSPPPLCPSPPLFRSGPPSRRPLPVRAAAPIKKGILFYVTATLPRPGPGAGPPPDVGAARILRRAGAAAGPVRSVQRSEEHTSELQSRFDLVCRLLLE